MKRNIFFARFLVNEEDEDIRSQTPGGTRDGLVSFIVEQYFTTNELYIIEPPSIEPQDSVETLLVTSRCMSDASIKETSNGLQFPEGYNHLPDLQEGYLNVAFDVVENGTTFPTLENWKVVSIKKDRSVTDNKRYVVAAYAIGTIKGQGSINTSALNQDNTVWISGTARITGDILEPGLIISNKFEGKVAFTHPTHLSHPQQRMEDYQFIEVYRERSSETDDCCASQIHSNAINAAAILVASNNATTPALIKKIEDAVINKFSLPSTLSALQGMRQLGTLSNMTSKVLDNVVGTKTDIVFNIKNGKEVE